MVTLFSMLFGAGILLLGRKAGNPTRLFVRQLILLVSGPVHAYLIWEGDILVYYALCGRVVYPLRNLSTHRLLQAAFLFWLLRSGCRVVSGVFVKSREAYTRVETLRNAGRPISSSLLQDAEAWRSFHPEPADIERLIAENRQATWWALNARRAPETLAAADFCAATITSDHWWQRSGLDATTVNLRRYKCSQ